ncbi:PII-interacting protein PipX family protein [Anthocerotibacter panamensis]|uniref:PII-interacting protein PipX family protein n=1 Tax=Anthocerotibacter panamensis TaxID=2857077 RepID=UPI001C406EC6|nr:PII-interacting protein PipX family protein [Anthocerotibacter panamensis]
MGEQYIHHPNFGLLYVVCPTLDVHKSLFTTLYAHRLFFVVTEKPSEPVTYEPVSRAQARQFVEERLKLLRRLRDPGVEEELKRTELFYKQTFL